MIKETYLQSEPTIGGMTFAKRILDKGKGELYSSQV
jgi:hypothetical protein